MERRHAIKNSITVHDTSNNYYKFSIYPNGAGFLMPADLVGLTANEIEQLSRRPKK
jgi:hypothetical protein